MAYTISVVSDEIAPDIDTAIRFAREQGLRHLDLRSIGGRNLIDLDDAEIDALGAKIAAADLSPLCFASPLLKWLPPGMKRAPQAHDAFGFDAGAIDEPRLFCRAFAICARLGIKRLRIFSYLAYAGFAPAHLDRPLSTLIDLAERHDCQLLLENEPVCNLSRLPALADFFAERAHPRLRLLFDLGNLQAMGAAPAAAEIAAVAPFVGYIHIKDYATGRGIVPLGEGDADHRGALAIIGRAQPLDALPFALETHLPQDGWRATASALAALRRLLAGS